MGSVYGAVVNDYGASCDISWRQTELDIAGPDSVLVRVEAASVNFADYLMVCGKYQEKPALPFVPGKSVIGVVEEIGPEVKDIAIGSVVLAWLPHGGYQTKVLVGRGRVFPVDYPQLDQGVVVGGFLSYLTATAAVEQRARVRQNDTVIVVGAAGDVGRAVVRRARVAGARLIIGIVSRKGHEAHVVGATPDVVLYASEGGVRQKILDITAGAGADVAIDLVGGDLFDEVRRSLAWDGRLVVVGFAAGKIPTLAVNYLLLKGISITGFQLVDYLRHDPSVISTGVKAYVEDLFNKTFAVPIAARIPLPEASRALQQVAAGGSAGKIVLHA